MTFRGIFKSIFNAFPTPIVLIGVTATIGDGFGSFSRAVGTPLKGGFDVAVSMYCPIVVEYLVKTVQINCAIVIVGQSRQL